jgi:hypothetical protein
METDNKTYGFLKDSTPLTDAVAVELVEDAFAKLDEGKGRLIKSPHTTGNQLRVKVSVAELPEELQQAALYK